MCGRRALASPSHCWRDTCLSVVPNALRLGDHSLHCILKGFCSWGTWSLSLTRGPIASSEISYYENTRFRNDLVNRWVSRHLEKLPQPIYNITHYRTHAVCFRSRHLGWGCQWVRAWWTCTDSREFSSLHGIQEEGLRQKTY